MDVALLPDGRLVVADIAAGTLSVLSGASLQERRVLASGLLGPTQMALGADGQIYVTEAGGRLSRVSPADGAVVVVADGLAQPEGIAPTPWGSFIVAEVGTRRLLEIVPGGERRVVAGDLPLGLQAGVQGLPPPYVVSGVAVGADGAVYFSADRGGKGAVYRLAPRP
jgi:DNA-binding beta-propeller fold protein YncE